MGHSCKAFSSLFRDKNIFCMEMFPAKKEFFLACFHLKKHKSCET